MNAAPPPSHTDHRLGSLSKSTPQSATSALLAGDTQPDAEVHVTEAQCRGVPAQPHRLSNALGLRSIAMLSDSLIYLVGAGLIGIGNIVLLPLYTHYLTAEH